MSFVVTSSPVIEPISLSEAKAHLKVEVSADDTLINALVQAAREASEEYLNLRLITQTVEQRIDAFPTYMTNYQIFLDAQPVQSISSIIYKNEAGDDVTLSTDQYDLDRFSVLHSVYAKSSVTWPIAIDEKNAVKLTYVAGFGDTSASVPALIKQAMLLMLTHWYENRSDTVRKMPTQSQWCLYKFRKIHF